MKNLLETKWREPLAESLGATIEFTMSDGKVISGRVQGSGGVLRGSDAVRQLEGQKRLADKEKPLRVYEPSPGHVLVYTAMTVHENGPKTEVDLRKVKKMTLVKESLDENLLRSEYSDVIDSMGDAVRQLKSVSVLLGDAKDTASDDPGLRDKIASVAAMVRRAAEDSQKVVAEANKLMASARRQAA